MSGGHRKFCMRKRRLFIIIAALICSMLAYICSNTLIQPPAAQAHAYVIGSDPVDGSTIHAVPAEVSIFFNAPISSISSAHIYLIQNASQINVGLVSKVSANDPRELITAIKSATTQPQGSYEVVWSAVANADAETTHGIIGFDVGFSSTGASPGSTILGPSSSNDLGDTRTLNLGNFTQILSVAWDWLVLAALIFWAGTLLIEFLLQQDKERNAELLTLSQQQTRSLQSLCLIILLIGELIALFLRATALTQTLQGSGFSFSLLTHILLETNYARIWFIRIILILLASGLLYWTRRTEQIPGAGEQTKQSIHSNARAFQQTTQAEQIASGPSRKHSPSRATQTAQTPFSQKYTLSGLVLAVLLLFTYVLTSDAAQVLQPQASSLVFAWLFLIAQCIWLGGFAYLGYVQLPLFANLELHYHTETLIILLKRLKPYFLVGIGTLLISDIYLSEASITNTQQWLNDPYGRTLLVQSALIVLMLLFSLYVIYVLTPRLKRQVLLLPVVDAELPARRIRQIALSNAEYNLRLVTMGVAWLGAGVLLCAALLAFFAPPIVFPDVNYNQSTSQANSASSVQVKHIGNLTVKLQITPGRVGYANTVKVTLQDSSGKAVSNAQVQLTTNMQVMDMGTGHATMRGGNPTYSATFDEQQGLDMAGLWNITVTIQPPGQATMQGTFQVMLNA